MTANLPRKGEKCEGCGIEVIGFWTWVFLGMKPGKYKGVIWHDLFEVEWFHHPKYSVEPYYGPTYDRFTAKTLGLTKKFYRMQDRRYWLCSECFNTAKEDEEKARKESGAKYWQDKQKEEEEKGRKYWEDLGESPLKGSELKVLKWFKENEGKKVKIGYWTDEGLEYSKNVEWVIESPGKAKTGWNFFWSDFTFHFPLGLKFPDKGIEKIHIGENEIELQFRYVTNLPIGSDFSGFEYLTRIWKIQLLKD
jgi:hypothetical protein